jgi:oligoribonuclease NrnB/cAMP/cGMP phosphodiesterase (DHH superfamily)
MNLIITHRSCPDGFCASFIAHKKYPQAEILPLNHGDPLPLDQVRGKDILVLDFSWKRREDNEAVAQAAKSIWILDHHKSSLEACQGLSYATFDMNRSGAGLAWDYLFGKDSNYVDPYVRQRNSEMESTYLRHRGNFSPRPWYVDYIEDYDLWNHYLISTKEVNAFLHSLNFDFAEWEELDKITYLDAAERGKYVVRNNERYVKLALKQAFTGQLIIPQSITDPEGKYFSCDYSIKIVNSLYTYASEIGAALVESGADIGMTWFERGDGMIQFSLRSLKGGPVDVSKIASIIAPGVGGGHQSASGAPLPIYQGRALIDSILNRKCGLGVKFQ